MSSIDQMSTKDLYFVLGTVLDTQSFSYLNTSNNYSLPRIRHMQVILPFSSTDTMSGRFCSKHFWTFSFHKHLRNRVLSTETHNLSLSLNNVVWLLLVTKIYAVSSTGCNLYFTEPRQQQTCKQGTAQGDNIPQQQKYVAIGIIPEWDCSPVADRVFVQGINFSFPDKLPVLIQASIQPIYFMHSPKMGRKSI